MTNFLRNFKQVLIFLFLVFFACLLALNKNLLQGAVNGIHLWVAIILPSLFPYFFITAILSKLDVIRSLSARLNKPAKFFFNVNGVCLYAYFLSVISGYPIGSKIVADLYKNRLIDKNQAVRATAFCSNSSPMFMIVSVGAIMFNDKNFGLCLFLSNLLATFFSGIIFRFYKKKEKEENVFIINSSKNYDNSFYDGVYSAVISILVVGGIITLCSLLVETLTQLNILYPFIKFISIFTKDDKISVAIIYGLFESTKGLQQLSSAPFLLNLPIACFLVGFGGISGIMQSVAFIKQAKIKTAPFFIAKILHAVLGFIFGIIFLKVFFV